MKLSRAIIPAALAGALLLAGCTAADGPSKDAAGKECLASGGASEGVAVKGDTGKDLKLTSKTPVSVKKKMERTVLEAGKGEPVKEGDSISVSMSMFNGADGEALQQQPTTDVPMTKDQLAPWAYEGIRCGVPGQQVAVVAPYAEVFGDAKASQLPFEGITEKDSIVVVMEFAKSKAASQDKEGSASAANFCGPDMKQPKGMLKKAEGKAKEAPKGTPAVKLAANGEPTITIPKGQEAPKKLEVSTLIAGDGETVKPGDCVFVNYRGVIWSTGKDFDSSWSRGKAINFTTTGVIGGFQKALEGQKVGSQVISIVPAEDGGYGAAGLEQMGHKKDDVMVFVLDILGTVHPE